MAGIFEWTGLREIDEALSYLHDKGARQIARACTLSMLRSLATFVRKQIKPSITPRDNSEKGIGSRLLRGSSPTEASGKVGVSVGKSGRSKYTTINRGKRRGVGISAANLHWFAAGTADRYTGSKKSGKRLVSTGKPRKFLGRIDKAKWGGFVQRGIAAGTSTAVSKAIQTANRLIESKAAIGRTVPVFVEPEGS